jgi:hypothetical protein
MTHFKNRGIIYFSILLGATLHEIVPHTLALEESSAALRQHKQYNASNHPPAAGHHSAHDNREWWGWTALALQASYHHVMPPGVMQLTAKHPDRTNRRRIYIII